MSILVKIFRKTKFWVNFSENLDFGKKKNEMLMLVIVFEKNLILGKIFENSDFCQHFRKSSRFW